MVTASTLNTEPSTGIMGTSGSLIGCPRNNQIFFGSNRNKPKLNLFRLFFGLFRETKNIFFGLSRCFGPVSKQPKQTEFSRNKPKQTEKISKTLYLLGSPRNCDFFSRFEEPKQTETQSVSVVFRFAFHETKKNFFQFVLVCFDVSDRY